MKETTLHSLITARVLFEEAKGLCLSQDRHLASAGVVVLQDALELVLYALLIEKNVDEVKNLESKSFDELIGELKNAGITVPKSGTLKALNKQRVITKHYGQLAEPATVRGYVEASEIALENILKQTIGKSFQDILLTDLLAVSEAREFLEHATRMIEGERYLDALTAVRKALYVQIEEDYSIYGWRDEEETTRGPLWVYLKGGHKAPFYKKNNKWIGENVREPMDYIQIDYEQLKLDAMEWGVNTSELQSLRRLTPEVFRASKEAPWQMKYDINFPANAANRDNAKYCLDRAIAILLKIQEHRRAARYLIDAGEVFQLPSAYLGDVVYLKAATNSGTAHVIQQDYEYRILSRITGFDSAQEFYYIVGYEKGSADDTKAANFFKGYLLIKEHGGVRDKELR